MFCIGCEKKGFDKLYKIDEERGGIRRYFKVKGQVGKRGVLAKKFQRNSREDRGVEAVKDCC